MKVRIRPTVISPLTRRKRLGRGFSLKEILSSGLTIEEAMRIGILIDKRRKSVHKENIEILKKLAERK